jgi:hypothetical protein
VLIEIERDGSAALGRVLTEHRVEHIEHRLVLALCHHHGAPGTHRQPAVRDLFFSATALKLRLNQLGVVDGFDRGPRNRSSGDDAPRCDQHRGRRLPGGTLRNEEPLDRISPDGDHRHRDQERRDLQGHRRAEGRGRAHRGGRVSTVAKLRRLELQMAKLGRNEPPAYNLGRPGRHGASIPHHDFAQFV